MTNKNEPNFAILRIKKLKSRAQISNASKHNTRQINVTNANQDKDIKLLDGREDALSRLDFIFENINVKTKKDSVLAIEYVMSFSPEQTKNIDVDDWARDNIDWINRRHGKDRILQAVLHLDETTPHLHILVTPIVENTIDRRIKDPEKIKNAPKYKLNCKKFTGSPKLLSHMQDSYSAAMAIHGLERGIINSKAKHQDIKEFYADINKNIKQVENELDDILTAEPNLLNRKKWVKLVKDKIIELAHSAYLIKNKEKELDKRERSNSILNNKLNNIIKKFNFDINKELEPQLDDIINTAVNKKTFDLQIENNNINRQINEIPELIKQNEFLKKQLNHRIKEVRQLNNEIGLSHS